MSSNKSTSAGTFLSNTHGRMRRAQRMIDKRDLQAAVKYGKCEESYNQNGIRRLKYTFADIVYITDETATKEITCWAIPGAGLDVQKHPISESMKSRHKKACEHICTETSSWTSHTVFIIDQSGSMRRTDVEGGATRSDAVWLTIAIDYVAKQLDIEQSSDTDVVSIVAMGITDTVLIDRKPHDWLLFNSVVDLLRKQEPYFAGNYIPALDAAEKLLLSNTYGNCILSLFFLSDGRPSDVLSRGSIGGHDSLMGNRIDSLASRFGRRLSVVTVGFAGPDEDFSVLQNMADRPAQFDSNGRFFAARLNPEALGAAFSSITSSLNQTRSELTAVGGSTQRAVRDVRRRAKDTVGLDLYPDDENWWSYYYNSWKGDRFLYSSKIRRNQKFISMPPLAPTARGVALADKFFGEGAERLVREFREIGPQGIFVGQKLVAKESRFQIDVANTDVRQIKAFHETFCNTQERAQRLAKVFNKRLVKVPGYDTETTPKISFLECSVYIVNDDNLGEIGMLVEKQLNPNKYKKWNDNCGAVDGQRLPEGEIKIDFPNVPPLDMIAESDEDDSEDEDVEEEAEEVFSIEDIPQAFSHFTYRYSKRKLLVCDLQGVLSSSPPLFELTDPVIHFMSHRKKKNVFGRTDRGWKGRDDFFRTHKCSPLCRMLNRKWVRFFCNNQRASHLDGLENQVSNLIL